MFLNLGPLTCFSDVDKILAENIKKPNPARPKIIADAHVSNNINFYKYKIIFMFSLLLNISSYYKKMYFCKKQRFFKIDY